VLVLAEDLRGQVHARCEADYPRETCGLLLGRDEAGRRVVERVFPARNVNEERPADRYELHPADYLAADALAVEAGLEIVGVYHSHPDHPSRPSATDLLHAQPSWSYLIVSVRGDGSRGRVAAEHSWTLVEEGSDRRFEGEPLG
jgi:proteasome lid subunit RPN8/RPN11